MNFWEFVGETEANAQAFYADALAHGYDVEAVFHARQGTDGRFPMQNMDEGYAVTVYMDFERVAPAISNALTVMAKKHYMQDWGSEPSTSFDSGERDGSVSAYL